ncbi:hypothetical protein CsatB_021961 [Cannabis sativa]|uniref:Uncharacterized protein n=2 Tax=Cannabis sativa TaxID=3483 RepID=A0A7J6DY37_CANSA|nr:hypothetical protein F8388_021698 [Cannabis sativa]KAF4355096.1 hypothetical protein G4B88_004308 [Cannabis sativa]
MEIVPTTYYENLKKYFKRKKYHQKPTKRKLLITRLGGGRGSGQRQRRRRPRKLMVELRKIVVSPVKLLAKFHETYVDLMIRLAGNMGGAGAFSGKKVAKRKEIAMVCCGSNQEFVDSRLLMEIYKRLAPNNNSQMIN